MINQLSRGRFLFVVDGCHMCAVWKSFIDAFNMELKVDKQITIIDCTEYYNFGISPDPLFDLFNKYINGHFPMLFIEGGFKYGTSTEEQAKDWLRARLDPDFLFRQHNPRLHNQNCKYIKGGKLKGQIICN